ncbi:MAG TPA: hypothetical protein VGA20_06310, partial [Gemmatimonadales bacterium]
DQGRSVLAVPGPITSPTSVGTNRLIQHGAKPALSVGDVLEELGMARPAPGPDPAGESPGHGPGDGPPGPAPELTDLQRVLWEALRRAPQHVDVLVSAAGNDSSGVLGALTELELKGVVSQRPGMVFALA